MRREWCVSALEFDVLWRLLGRDRLPYPLQCRGDAATAAEHRAARRAAARRIAPLLDDHLHAALSVLHTPTVRVEVCGFHGAGLSTPVRVHAGIVAGRGAVARQLPGADLDRGGDVLISTAPRSGVAVSIVDALPVVARATGRGPGPRTPGHRTGSVLHPAAGRDLVKDSRAFFARPRTGIGEIGVVGGPSADWRPAGDGVGAHWMDFADGRYLVRGDDAGVVPVSREELAAEIGTLIDRIGAAGQDQTTSHTAT
ncbi:hypothetical protein GCM10023094_00710 [Rhodococcus olei]|uniref:ESAT-6 protein secretion system EspG family protein n=1 Tax=Rhodococcus olei TaxID=2161675 RepID=A0ABP8NU03_9NOCA